MTDLNKPIILALDTSTEACSAALIVGEQHYFQFDICPREHNQRILGMVKAVLTEANLDLEEIDALAFGSGPGSFTGVRIATGIVQGLAFGADKPVIAISSLAAMAHGVHRLQGDKNVISAIDARMSEIYLGAYEIPQLGHINQMVVEKVLAPDDALVDIKTLQTAGATQIQWAGTGTGWQTYESVLTEQIRAQVSCHEFPHALDIAMLAQTAFIAGEAVDAENVRPSYLRNEVAWKKLPGK